MKFPRSKSFFFATEVLPPSMAKPSTHTHTHTYQRSNWSESDQVSQRPLGRLFNRSQQHSPRTTLSPAVCPLQISPFVSVWVDGALEFLCVYHLIFFFFLLLFPFFLSLALLLFLFLVYTFQCTQSALCNPYLSWPAVTRFTHRSSIGGAKSYTHTDKADTTTERRKRRSNEKRLSIYRPGRASLAGKRGTNLAKTRHS